MSQAESASNTSRRAFLATFAATAAISPAVAQSQDTPVLALYGEWKLRSAAAALLRRDEDINAAQSGLIELEDRMAATPSKTMRCLAAKIVALSMNGDSIIDNSDLFAEAKRFLD